MRRRRPAPACNGAESKLDAYAAQAAHQLGEAVALLRGYLVVLEQRGDRDPELGDALRGLSAGTARAQRFVDDLLDLAAAGRTEPAAELVSLDEALDTARRRLADELQDAGAEVRAGPCPSSAPTASSSPACSCTCCASRSPPARAMSSSRRPTRTAPSAWSSATTAPRRAAIPSRPSPGPEAAARWSAPGSGSP